VSKPTGGWHKVFLISSRVILSLPTSQLMNFSDMHVLKSRTQNARKFLVSVNLWRKNVEIRRFENPEDRSCLAIIHEFIRSAVEIEYIIHLRLENLIS